LCSQCCAVMRLILEIGVCIALQNITNANRAMFRVFDLGSVKAKDKDRNRRPGSGTDGDQTNPIATSSLQEGGVSVRLGQHRLGHVEVWFPPSRTVTYYVLPKCNSRCLTLALRISIAASNPSPTSVAGCVHHHWKRGCPSILVRYLIQ
jgi:hypothetical protein